LGGDKESGGDTETGAGAKERPSRGAGREAIIEATKKRWAEFRAKKAAQVKKSAPKKEA